MHVTSASSHFVHWVKIPMRFSSQITELEHWSASWLALSFCRWGPQKYSSVPKATHISSRVRTRALSAAAWIWVCHTTAHLPIFTWIYMLLPPFKADSNILWWLLRWMLVKRKMKVLAAQLCPTLCDPVDCNPPGSFVHRILQAMILERVAISFSRGSSQPRDRTWVSCIASRLFTIWATRKTLW